MPSLQGSS
jgi:hypothetical protein